MTDNITSKIAQIEAIRATIGNAAADAAIAALHGKTIPTTHAASDTPTTPSTPHPQQAGSHVQGTLNVRDQGTVQGAATGINAGTIQVFFGNATPPDDSKEMLRDYLTSLTSDCQLLRLQRLVRDQQAGTEHHRVPQLKLQAIYTSLTTNGAPVPMHERIAPAARMKRLLPRLRERDAADVPPEQVRMIAWDEASSTSADYTRRTRIERQHTERSLDDVPDDTLLRLTIARPELATEAIRANQRVVLLGSPGSGKSTVLRYLSLLLALRIQGRDALLPPGWDEQTSPMPVPLFCPLGNVARLLSADTSAECALWQAIEHALDDAQGSRAGLRNHLKPALRRGGVLLLFDGLDELPTSGTNPRQQIAQAIRRFAIQTAPNASLVITSRTIPYQTSTTWQMPTEEGWQVRTLQPLAFGQVQHFVRHWYNELAETLQEPAEARANRLIAALRAPTSARVRTLVESPLLLTMLSILHYNRNEIPDDRVEVYDQCVELLLDRWESVRTPDYTRQNLLARLNIPDLKTEQLREELHKLALQVHSQPPGDDGRGVLDGATLIGHMVRFFSRLRCNDPLARANMFVEGLVTDAGLLQSPDDDRYAFPHLTFQEYLAACGLADRNDMVQQAYTYWCGPDASRWREVLLLLMGRLRKRGSLSVETYAVAWLERLLAKKMGKETKTVAQRWQDVPLAALCYRDLGGQTALASTDIDSEARIEAPFAPPSSNCWQLLTVAWSLRTVLPLPMYSATSATRASPSRSISGTRRGAMTRHRLIRSSPTTGAPSNPVRSGLATTDQIETRMMTQPMQNASNSVSRSSVRCIYRMRSLSLATNSPMPNMRALSKPAATRMSSGGLPRVGRICSRAGTGITRKTTLNQLLAHVSGILHMIIHHRRCECVGTRQWRIAVG